MRLSVHPGTRVRIPPSPRPGDPCKYRDPLILFHRKLRPMKQKMLREDAHLREAETCRKRPRSARECAKAHSFLLPKIRGVKITCVILGNPVKYGQKIT